MLPRSRVNPHMKLLTNFSDFFAAHRVRDEKRLWREPAQTLESQLKQDDFGALSTLHLLLI